MVRNPSTNVVTFEGLALSAFATEIAVAVARARRKFPDLGQELDATGAVILVLRHGQDCSTCPERVCLSRRVENASALCTCGHPQRPENDMIAGKINPLEARERQLRDAASRKGMLLRKARGDQDHRYIIVDRDIHLIKRSRNVEFPYSFSLDEAESYLAG
jgi:hypothetical protein